VMVVLLGEYKLARGQVFGTCLALAGMEWGVFTLLITSLNCQEFEVVI